MTSKKQTYEQGKKRIDTTHFKMITFSILLLLLVGCLTYYFFKQDLMLTFIATCGFWFFSEYYHVRWYFK